jgi:PAS domain S-box-containing protein
MELTEASSLRITRLQDFSLVTGILVAAFGLVILLASLLNLTSLADNIANLASIKENTAITFVLTGVSLSLIVRHQKWNRLILVLSALVTILALIPIAEFSFNPELSFDNPGLMAPAAAIAITLIGVSLATLIIPGAVSLAQGFAITVLLFGFIPLIGYAYSVQALYSFGAYSSIPLPTAICFVLLSLGILSARGDEGLMRYVLGESVGGIMARRLLPAALVLPVVLGWLRLQGQRLGYFDAAMGTALLAFTHVVVFFLLILFNARLLRKTEYERAASVAEAARLSLAVQEHLSERNAARIRVTQSQEQLTDLIDSASDAIIVADDLQKITLFNPAAEQMFGVQERDVIGKPISRIINVDELPNDLVRPRRFSQAAPRLLHAVDSEGRKLQLETSISHVESVRGKSSTFILRDVTERRRAEQVTKKGEERLHALIENLSEGLVIADLDGQILHFNRAAIKHHGFTSLEECLLKVSDFEKLLELSTPDGRILPLEKWPLTRVIAGEQLRNYEVKVKRLDRDWTRIFNYGGTIVQEPNGRPLAFLTVTDITERKQAEESLREQTKILDLAPVMIRDLDGRILLWNSGAEQMYRWTADEALNQVSHELLQTEFPRPLGEIKARLIARDHWEGELVHTRKDGLRLMVASQWVLHRDETGNPKAVLEVTNDITERKLAEEEIRRLNDELELRVNDRTAQLQAANKELEAFSYSVSHDLRAPLRHINGFSQALLEDYEDKLDDTGKGYLNEVRQASQEMAQLIDDVLQLARVTRSEMHRESVNLSELAKGVFAELRNTDKDRTVEIDIQSDLVVQCDRRLMRIVLVNLIGNAWKFTSQRPRAEVNFGQAQENGEQVYFVRDNGAGFDMAFAGKLFGAFQRLHTVSQFEGTGIGLATVQRIIHRHGGRVWAEGKPDEGATFYFALPNLGETGDERKSDFSS